MGGTVTGWQLDVEPGLPGPVVVGGGTTVDPPVGCDPPGPVGCDPLGPVGCDPLGPVVCEPLGPVVCEPPPPGPEVAQVPGLGGAVAQAHTKKEKVSV